MKDGRISCQGTPDEIAEADPLIISESEKAIREVTESEAELSGAESETLLEERAALKKQISRQMSRAGDGTAGKSGTMAAGVDNPVDNKLVILELHRMPYD